MLTTGFPDQYSIKRVSPLRFAAVSALLEVKYM